jgi:hypothetical protein
MFDMNSLNKLADEIPEATKEKLKESALEKLGLSNTEGAKSPETGAATPVEQANEQAQPQSASEETTPEATAEATTEMQANEPELPESTDEDKAA